MNQINSTRAFMAAFNKVADKITSNRCAKNCYDVFERYLKMAGVPDEIKDDILSGFESWEDVFNERNENEYSLPVNSVIGKIKGITKAVNSMLNAYIVKLEQLEQD